MPRAAVLLLTLASCTPSSRSVEHALLDRGLDSIRVLGWAPSCAPRAGAYFEARDPTKGAVTGVVCCSRAKYDCDVGFTVPVGPRGPAAAAAPAPTPPRNRGWRRERPGP